MLKKLTLLAMSVAALLVFAAPAAQANGPLVTNHLGEAAKTITAHSTNTTTVTSNGTLECRTVTLHGNISENANTTAIGSGSGTAVGTVPANTHTGHCGIKDTTTKVHIESVTISSLHLTRHSDGKKPPTTVTTGTANFKYTYVITSLIGALHCTFEGTNVPVARTGTDTINVNGNLVRVAPSNGFCPSTGAINGDFTVTDEFGQPAHIH